MLTDRALFNIDPSSFKIKRRIALENIKAVSLSCYADNYCVVHVSNELDYVLISNHKTEFVSRLAAAIFNLTSKKLDINISPSILLRIDLQGTRELSFTKTCSGVTATMYQHPGAK